MKEMTSRAILGNVLRRGLQRNLGKETLSVDQALTALHQWLCGRLQEKHLDEVFGRTEVEKRIAMGNYNRALQDVKVMLGEELR